MGIAAAPPSQPLILPRHLVVNGTSRHHRQTTPTLGPLDGVNLATTSMSQGFHQGIFSFDGLDRSAHAAASQPQHIAQQSRRDKLRVQGFDDPAGPPLVPLDEGDETIYEPTGGGGGGSMLSDMFNFPLAAGPSSTDLLASQIRDNYRLQRSAAAAAGAPGFSGDWCGGNREGLVIDGGLGSLGHIAKPQIGDPHHQLSGLTADSAAAMHLFLNPLQQQPPAPAPRSPSSPRSQDPGALQQPAHTFFQAPSFAGSIGGGVVEGQGLSLSLSSSLHHQLEMARTEELRTTDRVLYYGSQHHEQPHLQQYQGGQLAVGHGHGHGQAPMHHVGFTSPIGVMTMLRHSKYARPAQELLDEFCSVSRGQLKVSRRGKHHDDSANPNPSTTTGPRGASTSGAAAAGTSSGKDDPPPLSAADRFEHQRKKAKLLSLLDEVERRYSHYCEQMQTVVNSFDSVMGFGAATPYTALAQKAMSRHFRCLKDAIAAQLKHTCDLLGEKDGGGASGLTKGETPRLKVLEQSLRHQRAFHQIGMIEQEAWRPQRGLPERSVNILRSWLFEHFLHPYPSDADKHWLARQTGLTKNQISNWFINARVRLWKPMVEDMYQQEAKDEGDGGEREEGRAQSPTRPMEQLQLQRRQPQLQRPEMNAADSDLSQTPSSSSVTRQPHHRQLCFTASEGAPMMPMARPISNNGGGSDVVASLAGVDALPAMGELCGPDGRVVPAGGDPRAGVMADYGAAMARSVVTRGRFGASGDVSLTLGLRQGGNMMETGRFSVGDFSDCS